MGLLDSWPVGRFGLLRNLAQGGFSAGAASDLPALTPQSPRLPLSFAGPALAPSFRDRPQAQAPTGNPFAAFPDGFRSVPNVQSLLSPGFARPQALATQNLTAHVLQTKGVPETDIAAAIENPALMKQLIDQHFGPGSNRPPRIPENPEASRAENAKPSFEDKPTQLAQVLFGIPPVSLFARPPIIPRQLTPLDELPTGSAGGPKAGMRFPRKLNEQQPPNARCTYCGKPTTEEPGPDQFNGDHIIPRAQGGNAEPENHTPACRTCNLKKRDRTPQQWYDDIDREET